MTTAVTAVVEDNAIENVVVERFVEASRELVPHVQVSLAKKMVMRGSNQVVCLAANTSVPLNEDELASFSELALRLADGTNVVLNLSFFNDQDGGQFITNQYIPYDRCIYDPNRYVIRGQPRLGFVVFLIAAMAVGGFYYITKGRAGAENGVATASMVPILAKRSVHKPAKKLHVTKPAKKASVEVSKPSVAETSKGNSGQVRRRSSESRPRNPRQAPPNYGSGGSGLPRMSGMVPPPPPNTYSLPSIYEYAPFNPMQPVPAASRKVAKPHNQPAKVESKVAPRSLELPSAAAPTNSPIAAPVLPSVSAANTTTVNPVAIQAQNHEPIQLERIQTVNGIAPLAVPLPGNNPPLHLERLNP